jgi:SEL1 protein
VYYRQQRRINHQRETQEQNQAQGAQGAQGEQGQEQRPQEQQQDRGMFPREGDADFMPWLAGGVGH